MKYQCLFLIILILCSCTGGPQQSYKLDEVQVSMHMVLPVASEGRYYITGTTDLENVWEGKPDGFYVYSSTDLVTWDRSLAWEPPEGSEWDQHAWGAIILPWQVQYIMLGSDYSTQRRQHCILTMLIHLN